MVEINEELLETKIPYNNKKYFDSLLPESREKYLKLYSLYNSLLIQYLIKKYNLKLYDQMIQESNRDFKKVDIKDMDIYQYTSSKYLDYLYIRNNIYIERLSNEELLYLDTLKETLNSNGEQFIENTYKKVIFNDGYTMYGPDNSKFLKKSNSIILGLRCKGIELENNDEDTDKFLIQKQYLKLFIPELSRQLNNRKLDDIEIIEYTNSSIIKCQRQKYIAK